MAYTPTHRAPAGGLPAWSEPDPSLPPVTTLAFGTELVVVEERGQWARVEASNGWSGWVDGARLVGAGVSPGPAAPVAPPLPAPLPAVGTPALSPARQGSGLGAGQVLNP